MATNTCQFVISNFSYELTTEGNKVGFACDCTRFWYLLHKIMVNLVKDVANFCKISWFLLYHILVAAAAGDLKCPNF